MGLTSLQITWGHLIWDSYLPLLPPSWELMHQQLLSETKKSDRRGVTGENPTYAITAHFKKRKIQLQEKEVSGGRAHATGWSFSCSPALKQLSGCLRLPLDLWYFSFRWKDNSLHPHKGFSVGLCWLSLGASLHHFLRLCYKKHILPIGEMEKTRHKIFHWS